MASGKVHDWVTHVMVIPTIIAAYAIFEFNFWDSIIIACGMWFGGIFLSPDLDIVSGPFYRWGPFRFIWLPYQWVAKHRSTLSHGIIFAPFIRLVYLTAICILVYFWGLESLQHHGWFLDVSAKYSFIRWFKANTHNFIVFGIGIWLGSFFHVVMDILSSTMKRVLRFSR